MKKGDAFAGIVLLALLLLVLGTVKSILFPPDPEYVARQQELALEHAARMHTIEEAGVVVLFALLAILAVIGIIHLYHRARIVQIRPDEGGQYPILKLRTPDGRHLLINPNRLMAGAGVVEQGGLREILPQDSGLMHMQHRVTTQDQAVQMARAAGAHGPGLFHQQDDVVDGHYEEVLDENHPVPVTVLQNVTGEDVDRALGLEADGDW